MKLHDLHVLMAVAQVGSMRKAAALLNTTQPAISRSIAQLEHTFGVRLLDRSPQGIEPTQYGHALLRRGVAVFDELKKSGQDMASQGHPAQFPKRISIRKFSSRSRWLWWRAKRIPGFAAARSTLPSW